tara:strand:- start:4284 stop:6368 length:2085 start_codon:yes stop_codon:yes gene_type:complete
VAESIVTLRVDTRNAVSSLNNASAATNRLSAASRGTTKSLAATSTAAKGLGTALRNSVAPILAVGTAFSVVNNSIGTFLARERDIAILEQGISNLGAGSASLRELQKAADELGKTTLFNQEEFTRGFNLLTSFRNIGVDSYSRVAQAAADIAQVNQVDVSTSFMQLAKALQDPERNLSNLNRSGIAFTKQQTKVIKELMKTNQVAKAHTMILDIVDESYNKLAQAAAVGFAGSVDTLGESFRDFSEALGKSLIPVVEPAVKALTALLNALSGEGGQAVAIITGAALAFKGLSVVIAATKAQLATMSIAAAAASGQLGVTTTMAFATAGGFAKATAAATAFKVALAKTGIGLAVIGLGMYITKLLEGINEQRTFNELLEQGTANQLRAEIAELEKEQEILNQQLDNTNRLLMGIAGFAGLDIFTRSAQDIKLELAEVNNQLIQLKEGLPNAEARDLKQQFNLQLENLKKQNAELTKSVQRDQIKGEEKKKEFDLEQQIAAIKREFEGEEEARLVSLAKQNHELNKQKTAIEQANEAAKRQGEIFKKIGDNIATGVSDALHDAVMQTRSLGDAARSILQGIASDLLRLGINTLLKSTGFGIFSNLPGFANGGRPPANRPSIVGEKGPEIFVPSSAGTIIPNNKIGGGVTNNIVVNVDASGSNVEGDEDEGRQLGVALSAAIESELIKQKRPGGLLA